MKQQLSTAAFTASFWALVLSWFPFITGVLQLTILVFGAGAGYWAWRANRARAKQLERNDLLQEIKNSYNANHEADRNNQHRGFGETDDE